MNGNQKASTVGAIMLIAGGLIGAGIGILFAPQSGKRTRRQISRYSKKVKNETEALIRDSAEAVRETVDTLADRTSDLVEKGGEVAEEWREHLMDALEEGQKSIDRQRRRLTNIWK
ncbi:hypothetical protein DBW_0411 [Desulfuromonas sp. DDH964]|uniref:YtxH domain-containing protein n=1 Tax=Desulfuromonas sp. DDH964 TaxID=1823759 RepID=UPI00078D4DC5|nr:YtxH domain-containing protein [Desulfuromonas sp. DDH964]AMV70813.1 hypothetical protein DBW_0411 [Desulfuromonas sp. DDH964]